MIPVVCSCLSLSLFIMNLKIQGVMIRCYLECPQFRFVWHFFRVRWHWSEMTSSRHIRGTCCGPDESLLMLIKVTWPKFCLPGFSIVKLFPTAILYSGTKPKDCTHSRAPLPSEKRLWMYYLESDYMGNLSPPDISVWTQRYLFYQK
jgi:hypothetical protein